MIGEFDFNLPFGLKVGDEIIIVQSNEEELKLIIKEFPMITKRDGFPLKHLSISVGNVEKEIVPIGSEVFIEVLQ